MIPKSLRIQGFLSYINPVDINFEGLHLASITGANGAGKSSILDAITWVMFGKARARDDQVINQQSDTAIVSVDFSYENQNYRIRRTKQIEKSLVLEFYIFDPDTKDWRTLTEHSVTETQKRIISTLRMDYNTFTNASFFLQGKADQFTQLPPGERKDILSNILGLEIWEEYLQKAREKRKNLEVEQKSIELTIENILTELSLEEQSKAKLAEEEKQLENKTALKLSQNTLLNQAIQLEKAKEKMENQISQLETDISKINDAIEKNRNSEIKLLSEMAVHEKFLENSQSIEEKYQKWQMVRHELEEWNNKFSIYHNVNNKLSSVNQKINDELTSLNNKKESFEKMLREIENYQSQIPLLEKELEKVTNQQEELKLSIEQKQALQNQKLSIQKEISEKQLSIDHLSKLNDEKRSKLKEFRGAGPECPFCLQPLTKEHREKYEALVIEEGVNRKKIIDQHQKEIATNKINISEIDNILNQIEKDERLFNQLNPKISDLNVRISKMNEVIADWKNNQKSEYLLLNEKLEKKDFLKTDLAEKEKLEKEISSIGYDESKHRQSKVIENELRPVEIEFQKLITAKTKIEPIPDQLNEIRTEINLHEKELLEKNALLEALKIDFQNQFVTLQDTNILRQDLDEIDKEINLINHRIGAEKQKLETIERKKQDKIKFETEFSDLSIQINRFKKIEEAFGKNGVPALLIEQALPEIEMHANELLDRLSNSQLSIHFETQSEYKDKKRKDKKETLEILINDAFGHTRAYDMFSGGEAFRINFAIRLALSQVLAKRSGARLETLVVDEGFGSQDDVGRNRLVETINIIKKDFAKLLIITHLEELKDAFPARIEVEKTSNGSQVEIMVY
jgi:exonuclease SbcC